MDPLILSFATALVSSMATETWSQARDAVLSALRRRKAATDLSAISADLDASHERVQRALEGGTPGSESAMISIWIGKIQELLLDHPELAEELQQALNDTLLPMLTNAEATRIRSIYMTGTSHGQSTFNQVGGNQYNVRS